MKKAILLLTISLLIKIICYGQNDYTLPGVVVEQNSKYRTGKIIYLENATIESFQASKPERSDSEGRFTLYFSDLPMGDSVFVTAKKVEFELVNKKELRQAAVVGRLSPLKIVMCPSGQLYENEIKYYGIAQDAILKRYKDKVRIINEDLKQKDVLIAELQVEFKKSIESKDEAIKLLELQYSTLKDKAARITEKFVVVNLDDESENYLLAFQSFQRGEIEEAIKILENTDLRKRLEFQINQRDKQTTLREQIDSTINDLNIKINQEINQCIFLARLQILDFNFSKAEYYYKLAYNSDTTNISNVIEYANFLADQNEHHLAIPLYEKIVKNSNEGREKALAQYILAGLYISNYDSQKAQKMLQEALSFYVELLKNNQMTYELLEENIKIIETLGTYYMNKDTIEPEKAEYYYSEVMNLYMDLSEDENIEKDYREDLAGVFINYANCIIHPAHPAGADFKNAEAYLLNSLEIYKLLINENPDKKESLEPAIIVLFNSLGAVYSQTEKLELAEAFYSARLQIQEKLVEKNPKAYELEICITLSNLIGLEIRQTQKDSSLARFLKCDSLINLIEKKIEIYSFDNAERKIFEFRNELGRSIVTVQGSKAILRERNLLLEKINNESNWNKKVELQIEIISLLDLYKSWNPYKNVDPFISNAYGNLSYYMLFTQNFSESLEAANQGLEIDSSKDWIITNKVLSMLFLEGRFEEAKKIYLNYKDKPYNEKTFKDAFLEDFNTLESEGITNENFDKIRNILK